MSRWRVWYELAPPMGRASKPGDKSCWRSQTGTKGSWELWNLCFVRQLLEQGPDLANTTLRPEVPGADTLRGPK